MLLQTYPKQLLIFFTLMFSSHLTMAQGTTNIGELETELQSPTLRDSFKIELLNKLSSAYRLKDRSKAIQYARMAISEARTLDNKTWLALTLIKASSSYIETGEFKEAIKTLQEALNISQSHKIPHLEIKALSNLGAAYLRIGVPEKASEYMTLAYLKAEHLGDKKLMAVLSLNIGNLYLDLGDHQRALVQLQKSLTSLKEQQDWDAFALAYINIGVAYTNLKRFDRAKIAFDSTKYVINHHTALPIRQISLNISEAILYIDGLNQPRQAIQILEKMFSLKEQDIPAPAHARSLQLLALAYLNDNSPKEALSKAIDCRKLLEKMEMKNDLTCTTYEITSNIYAALGEWEQAHQWAKSAIKLRDSLDLQAQRQTASFALFKQEIESSEKELRENNLRLEARQKIYSVALLVGIPALTLLFAAIYFRSMQLKGLEVLKKKESLNEELESKVKERTKELEKAHDDIQEAKERENISLALLNQQHSELLENTIVKMKLWQKTNMLNDIQSAINELKSAQTRADEWGDFMLHFERIHPDFSKKLLSYNPELNPSELKHCAYMQLSMTRKQVADTLHTSDNAVRLARNRIKKKLNIDPEESLQDFINAL